MCVSAHTSQFFFAQEYGLAIQNEKSNNDQTGKPN